MRRGDCSTVPRFPASFFYESIEFNICPMERRRRGHGKNRSIIDLAAKKREKEKENVVLLFHSRLDSARHGASSFGGKR